MYVSSSATYQMSVNISNCQFSGNWAAESGGAVVLSSVQTSTLLRITATNNTAQEGSGGALSGSLLASLHVSGGLWADNSAQGAGGALAVSGVACLAMSDVMLARNTAGGQGGAMSVETPPLPSPSSLLCPAVAAVLQSSAPACSGSSSGMCTASASTSLLLHNVTATSNHAGSTGGAFSVQFVGGTAPAQQRRKLLQSATQTPPNYLFSACSLTHNTAAGGDGGGLALQPASTKAANTSAACQILLAGCSIIGNTASSTGGGVSLAAPDSMPAILVVHSSTLSSNTAAQGGSVSCGQVGAALMLNASTVSSSNATWGGGVAAISCGAVAMLGGTHITACSAHAGGGGGVLASGVEVLLMQQAVVTGCNAAAGGGLYVEAAETSSSTKCSASSAVLSGSEAAEDTGGPLVYASDLTLSNNTALGGGSGATALSVGMGGGAWIDVAVSAVIVDSTASGNAAVTGGGLASAAQCGGISNTTLHIPSDWADSRALTALQGISSGCDAVLMSNVSFSGNTAARLGTDVFTLSATGITCAASPQQLAASLKALQVC